MSGEGETENDNGYEVGYGKPPRKTQFQKGRSGNPTGRPRGSRSFITSLLKAYGGPVTVKENGRPRQITKQDAAAIQIVNKAVRGDLRCAKFIAEQIGDLQKKEAQKVIAQNGSTARERITKKLDDLAAHIRQRQGLPPEDSESPA